MAQELWGKRSIISPVNLLIDPVRQMEFVNSIKKNPQGPQQYLLKQLPK